MHVIVSWDIKSTGDRWTELNDRLKSNLKTYSWVRPISTFYIVKVSGESQRKSLIEGLNSVASSVSETVHIVVSPAMSAGSYNGYLPKDMWEKIRERAK